MDHDDVLEQLDLAAVEPGGLDRLTAGDTPTAAAVVGHLAGCPDCSSAYERIRAATPLLRDVVRTMPPADLRARTLDRVRAVGVVRGGGAESAAPGSESAGPVVVRRSRPAAIGWLASMAAAVVLAFGAGTLAARPDATQVAEQAQQLRGLGRITMATLALAAEPDVRRVALAATTPGSTTAGTLLFSPSTTELVVVAEGLPRPAEGREYRCWMDRDGTREDVGRMFFAGDLAFWVGATPGVETAAPGTTFGVSLTEVGGASLASDPVIAGDL
jgi:Anti-sigma-K factor rskA